MSSDIRERLKASRDALAVIEAKADEAEELRELAVNEVTIKLAETHGLPGKDFAVLDTTAGPIALKPGLTVYWKKYLAKVPDKGQPTHEDAYAYVAPCVIHPSRDDFDKILETRPAIVQQCANVLTDLYQGKDLSKRPK